jgi:hypothetical protein
MNLNHHDIHEIFTQISHSLACPKCKAQVLPHNIKITNMMEGECFFDIDCHKCKSEISLSAHIEKNTNDFARTYNQSSKIVHDNIVEEGVSEWDIKAIQNELQHFGGSFIEAFAR